MIEVPNLFLAALCSLPCPPTSPRSARTPAVSLDCWLGPQPSGLRFWLVQGLGFWQLSSLLAHPTNTLPSGVCGTVPSRNPGTLQIQVISSCVCVYMDRYKRYDTCGGLPFKGSLHHKLLNVAKAFSSPMLSLKVAGVNRRGGYAAGEMK